MDEQNERIYFSDDCYLDCVSQNLYYKGQIIRRNIGGIPYEIVYLMSGYPCLMSICGFSPPGPR